MNGVKKCIATIDFLNNRSKTMTPGPFAPAFFV